MSEASSSGGISWNGVNSSFRYMYIKLITTPCCLSFSFLTVKDGQWCLGHFFCVPLNFQDESKTGFPLKIHRENHLAGRIFLRFQPGGIRYVTIRTI